MIRVDLSINNVTRLVGTDAYGDDALWRLESATSEDGTYAEIATDDLVAGTNLYSFWDPNGTNATWYRFRVSTGTPAVAGDYSAYSDAYRATALAAYADVDDLMELLPDSPDDTALNWLAGLLVSASSVIDRRSGRQFYRIPQVSGTVTRLYDGDGTNRIVIPEGIVSVTSLEIATTTGQAFITQDASDYFLEPAHPEAGDSYYIVEITDLILASSFMRFPRGKRNVRVVGVLGYDPAIEIIRLGTLALAREMYALSPTGRGSASGAAGQGSIAVPDLLPRATYDAIQWGGNRMRWVDM